MFGSFIYGTIPYVGRLITAIRVHRITASSEQQHTITILQAEQQHTIGVSSEQQHNMMMIRDDE